MIERRAWLAGLAILTLAYAHHTLPYLTTMPRVNMDEPWLIERAFEVMRTWRSSQPMVGLNTPYMLQVGFGYLYAPWLAIFGVGMLQARMLAVLLGFGTVLAITGAGALLAGRGAGLLAGAFLLSDSSFLGDARMARSDMPAVFFIALALLLFVTGRDTGRTRWYAASGVSTAAAILCHGNSFWIGVIFALWCAIDYGRRMFVRSAGYAYVAGLLLALTPYLMIVLLNRQEVAGQINTFVGERVPGWHLSFLLEQIRLEPQRYHDWYFGLITDTVRNPLLRTFQIAIVLGISRLAFVAARDAAPERRKNAALMLVLALGAAAIFAAFINNKVPVYMPHLLLGFSLVAGAGAAWGATLVADALTRFGRGRKVAAGTVIMLLVASHAIAGVGYYEKWYSLTRRTELLPYESTARTIENLLPAGPKYVFASPQFWVPFAGQTNVQFFSHAVFGPVGMPGHRWPELVRDSRPVFLLIDERHWEPELIGAAVDQTWQRPWIDFITRQCRLRSYAPGTAYGTLAAYECARDGAPAERPVFLASDTATYEPAPDFVVDGPIDPKTWSTSTEPKFPGIERSFDVAAGQPYLLSAEVERAAAGDLVYIGRWSPSEVTSLSGGASAGIVEPARRPAWFPGGHAFIATVPRVRVLFYSERSGADFAVRKVSITGLKARSQ